MPSEAARVPRSPGSSARTRPRIIIHRQAAQLLVILGLLTTTACGGTAGLDLPTANGRNYIAGRGVETFIPSGERQQVPPIAGDLLGGGHLNLADLRGKVIVVNVWGSWCPPCREEAPYLQKVWQHTRRKGVRFVGIDIRDNQAAAQAFVDHFNITYPSLFDRSGQLLLAFHETLPPQAIPSTVIIDREGMVAARIVGATTYLQLRTLIERILGKTVREAHFDL